MGWSLDYLPPKEPELLDEFFLAAGKALYLACAFESKCQHVLWTFKVADHFEKTGDASASLSLFKVMKEKLLGQTINALKRYPDFKPNDITILEKARNARNFIAHECADIGPLSAASSSAIQDRLDRLRHELKILAAGDNLVSCWVYELAEKEPAPRLIRQAYPKWVEKWVFGKSSLPESSE